MSASCKYLTPSHEADSESQDCTKRKPGYFTSEEELVLRIRKETETKGARNPITFLVEAGDDIVYSVADMEDGIKKGILSWEVVREEISRDKNPTIQATLEQMESILKAGENSIPADLPDDRYASAFRTATIARLVSSVSELFAEKYEAIMDGQHSTELILDCDAAVLVKRLKQIGKTRIYCTPPTLKLELMGRKVIGDLMDIFWEGAENLPLTGPPKTKHFPGKAGALLSENYRRVFQHFANENTSIPQGYHRFQLVTDYICGMTDSFAKTLHAELTNGV